MFDTVILGRSCPGKEYDQYEPMLRMKVFEAQQACREKKIPLLIIVSGLESTGRGQVMNKISEWMDGKFLTNHVFWRETDEQRERMVTAMESIAESMREQTEIMRGKRTPRETKEIHAEESR